MINALDLVDLVERRVIRGERDGEPTKIVILRRRYDADVDQVWDAFSNAERLPRWFLPVSGELRLGGRYQFEGNAGGVIETCRRPELIKVTWEYEGDLSWVELRLSAEAAVADGEDARVAAEAADRTAAAYTAES